MTPKELKAARKRLGLSQVRLGELLDRSERAIRDYESGAADIDRCLDLAVRYLQEHPPK